MAFFTFCWSSQRRSENPAISAVDWADARCQKQEKWCQWGTFPSNMGDWRTKNKHRCFILQCKASLIASSSSMVIWCLRRVIFSCQTYLIISFLYQCHVMCRAFNPFIAWHKDTLELTLKLNPGCAKFWQTAHGFETFFYGHQYKKNKM